MTQRDGSSAPGCSLKAEAPGSLFTAAQLETTTESSKIVPNKCLLLSTYSAMATLYRLMPSCITAIRWWLDHGGMEAKNEMCWDWWDSTLPTLLQVRSIPTFVFSKNNVMARPGMVCHRNSYRGLPSWRCVFKWVITAADIQKLTPRDKVEFPLLIPYLSNVYLCLSPTGFLYTAALCLQSCVLMVNKHSYKPFPILCAVCSMRAVESVE